MKASLGSPSLRGWQGGDGINPSSVGESAAGMVLRATLLASVRANSSLCNSVRIYPMLHSSSLPGLACSVTRDGHAPHRLVKPGTPVRLRQTPLRLEYPAIATHPLRPEPACQLTGDRFFCALTASPRRRACRLAAVGTLQSAFYWAQPGAGRIAHGRPHQGCDCTSVQVVQL